MKKVMQYIRIVVFLTIDLFTIKRHNSVFTDKRGSCSLKLLYLNGISDVLKLREPS